MKYCCFCGKELVFKTLLDGSEEKYCQICDRVFFNTPSPAVIVAITKDNGILLTRSVGWKHPYWGLVAGHVKAGETAEEAAIREVREEVDLNVFDIQFLGTYALKHRNLLMLGFSMKTLNESINKSKELENAAWFKLSDPLPIRPGSITTQMIRQIFADVKLANSDQQIVS